MKLNLDNFLASDETKADEVWYIKDDDLIVRKANHNRYDFIGCRYHYVKWWAYIKANGRLMLLMYIENPKQKYNCETWLKRRKYFCEIYETLEKGV